MGELALERLDARQVKRIEGARVWRGRRAARDLEDGVVAIGPLSLRSLDDPANVPGVGAHGQRQGPDAVARHVALNPLLRRRQLPAHHALGILGEVRVPERVVADLVAAPRKVLQLAPRQLLLIEEAVGRFGARQDVEGRRAAEFGVLAFEGLEDADGAVGVQHPVAAPLDQPELTGRRIVECEDDGRRAPGYGDPAVEEIVERYQAIAALPEALEVAAEVGRGAGPALLG